MNTQKLVQLLRRARDSSAESYTKLASSGPATVARKLEIDVRTQEELIHLLSETPEFDCFNEKMVIVGMGASRVTYEMLARHLVCRTLQVGAEQTVEELKKYIQLDFTPVYKVIAVSGIEVEKDVELGKGIRLIPFESVPECGAKRFLLAESRALAQLEPPAGAWRFGPMHPTAALTKKVEVRPKTYDSAASGWSFDEAELDEVCDCLTLVAKSTPVVSGFWGTLEDWVPCSVLLDPGWLSGGHDAPNIRSYKFKGDDYDRAADCFSKYLNLPADVQKTIRIALQRLNLSRRRVSQLDKAIDLGIALEALLLHDRSRDELISYPLRLRGAWLLGNNAEERGGKMLLLKEIYASRCEAVHSGTFNSKFTRKLSRPIGKLLEEGDNMCVQVIESILKRRRFPEWDSLVLGAECMQ